MSSVNQFSYEKIYIYLNILCFCFCCCVACSSDNNSSSIEKTDCIVSGILSYNNDYECWQIREVIPNTIDVVNVYLIVSNEMDFSEYINQSIKVIGVCYRNSEQIDLPVGATLYNIEVKSLNLSEE